MPLRDVLIDAADRLRKLTDSTDLLRAVMEERQKSIEAMGALAERMDTTIQRTHREVLRLRKGMRVERERDRDELRNALRSAPPSVVNALVGLLAISASVALAAVGWAVSLILRHGG